MLILYPKSSTLFNPEFVCAVSDAFKKTECDGDQNSSDVATASQGDPAQR